jgi:hypothetical protein
LVESCRKAAKYCTVQRPGESLVRLRPTPRSCQDWWESFQYGRPENAPEITWNEFTENFRSYHIPEGLIELKQEEFRALKQGSMSVAEYHDKFAQLSRYAPAEVARDSDK